MEFVPNMDFFDDLEEECQAAAMETMELLRQDVVNAQVMPFDSGDLQNNLTHVEKLPGWVGARLITDGPYAPPAVLSPGVQFPDGKQSERAGALAGSLAAGRAA